ncbi:hypothetical protein JR316_0001943 [Psilocybe cubensis]|uniref:Asteroid domain-containing protein n=2 Tax=Psilocybe cubensis TaxID=181762 RepID=A0A8H7Y2P0_PSICU|nr:hypothetical protein JR316_0001943 [Psilocybe cubensis]KAH9485037.1 hypothetical protein JR316_0001943 [Psilocybe cubensis]
MGVHGLTTYLREKRRTLSTTTIVSGSTNSLVPVVVDGWSFIYDLYQSSRLPWVYGGEYIEFVRLVQIVVQAWIKAGLEVHFVFDGACPDLKFATIVSRLGQSHVLPAQLFFRTSSASRSSGRFLGENRILPPLTYSACLYALEVVRRTTPALEIHFADEEGDPYAVELAGRLEGYVVGNDSDFVILNSEGYRGYIPLDELVWQLPPSEATTPTNEVNDDFQTVKTSKAKKKIPQYLQHAAGLLPPDNTDGLSLSFTSYSPQSLAKHLNIPVTLLPLFGALVGNDFSRESESSSRKIQGMFFERHLTLSQRIDKVANIMKAVVSPGTTPRGKAKHQVGSVMDLIDRTVNCLLDRQTAVMGSGEIESIIDKIVNATLQYAIPKHEGDVIGRKSLWPTSVCALHMPESCPILPIISHNVVRQAELSDQADPNLLEARGQLLDAYRNGMLSPKTMDILNTASSWPRLFLENPDLETVARSLGRPIREWIYAILQDSLGLPFTEAPDGSTGDNSSAPQESDDDDELIDVVESDDEGQIPDYLAPLRGELDRLHSDDDATEPPASIISHRKLANTPPTVTEYVRRGSRIASEEIVVKSISDLLSSIDLVEFAEADAPPLVLRSDEDRLTILLRILNSDIPSVRSLTPDVITSVLALRWVVNTLHSRWQETGSKDREKERWSKNEARCLLSSFTSLNSVSLGDVGDSAMPPIEDRNVQLTAQILMALESIEQLSQSLLLLDRVPGNAYQLSGKLFHGLLTGTAPMLSTLLHSSVWAAVEEGLSDCFQDERAKRPKKPKAAKVQTTSIATNGARANTKNKGLFSMLGDLED